MTARPNAARFVLGVLPIVLVPAAFIAARSWLETALGDTMMTVVAGTVAIFVMGYANYFALRFQRGQDEVRQAGLGFATQWGVPAGQAAFVLLLLLPPFQDLATRLVGDFAGDDATGVDRSVVVSAMTLGFCAIVLLQTIGLAVVNSIWWMARR